MPVWNRTDYERFYSFNAEPWGFPSGPQFAEPTYERRYHGKDILERDVYVWRWVRSPVKVSDGRQPIRLHYHDFFVGRQRRAREAFRYRDLCGLQPGDEALLVGAGFNHSAEGLSNLGVTCHGLDTSDYILAEKDNTEEAEIRDCCTRAGVDPDNDVIPIGRGNEIVEGTGEWVIMKDTGRRQWTGRYVRVDRPVYAQLPNEPAPRRVDGENFLDIYLRGGRAAPAKRGWGTIASELMDSNKSVNAVARLYSGSPKAIITEETLNSISDAEALQVCEAAQRFKTNKSPNAVIYHALSPLQPDARQAPELNWKTYGEWRAFLDANGFSDHLIIPTVTHGDVKAYAGTI